MKVNIAFHNVDHSDALQKFIQEKSQHIHKLLWRGEDLDWVIEHDAVNFSPKLKLKLNDKMISISASARNAFSAVNEVIEKAKRVIRDDHKKLQASH